MRTYRKLTPDGRQRLAFWFMSDNVLNGTAPYLDLPATGSDGRSARGYSDGRYRGQHLAYGEMEYRGTITSNGLLGFVRSPTRRPSTMPTRGPNCSRISRPRPASACGCC